MAGWYCILAMAAGAAVADTDTPPATAPAASPQLQMSNRLAPSPAPDAPAVVTTAPPGAAATPAPETFLSGMGQPAPPTLVTAPPHAVAGTQPASASPAAPAPLPVARAAPRSPPAVTAPRPLPPVAVSPPPPRPALTPVPTPLVVQAGDDPNFPHLAVLGPQVAFWTKVFSEYSENQTVIHSMDDLRKVYTVLDFSEQAKTMGPVALYIVRKRDEARARDEVEALLKRVDALQATPEKMDAAERRIYAMYADSSDPKRFRNAIASIRLQHGLRERTAQALVTSGRYLPQMEQIFASYGLPTRLTRLPLVESSFNVSAYSKAGAAGVWQFIPSSARIYMRLDEIADDRRDPWLSTDAAARHLRDDYNALQSWPLAVTAYDYGRGGLVQALNRVGGTSLVDLLERYDSRRFGFASRNYYAEFLAANDIERDWRAHFGELQREAPTSFETVETKDYVPYSTLRRLSGTSADQFRTLNPAYNDEVVDGRLYVPPGQIIRVPAGDGERFNLAYASLTTGERFEQQRSYYTLHQVVRGDSIGRLARRFGVSTGAILAANNLGKKVHLRAGETLRIPPREGRPVTVIAAAEPAVAHAVKTRLHPADKAPPLRTYHVHSGQSLSTIAHKFRISVDRLRQINGLSDSDLLHVGSTLKVPLQ